MSMFSVVIPVYNAAHTIERCVDSVLACGGDLQVILVEDCSRDNSWEVCCALAEKYPAVTALHNEQNRGVSYTRNRGLDAAVGTYLLFVDSDDWVDEKYISSFHCAAEMGAQLAICGYVNHDEKQNNRTDVFAWHDFDGTKEIALREEIKELYDGRLLQQLWNKLFVNAIVQNYQIRFDESISIGEDTRFVLNYIHKSGVAEITLINQPLYHYMRDQNGSLMFRVGYESVEESLKNLRKLYEIQGLAQNEIEMKLHADRQKQIEQYAYLIMHNAGMRFSERKKLILALDEVLGKQLLKNNLVLYFKEKIKLVLRKMTAFGR